MEKTDPKTRPKRAKPTKPPKAAKRKSKAYPDLKPEPGLRVAEPVPGYLVAPLLGGLAAMVNLFPPADMADILEVSSKTLNRWKKTGAVLSPQQSDRLANVEAILKHGEDVLGSQERAVDWMYGKVFFLQGRRPIDVIKTETGRREVDNALGVIEWGMF